MTQPDETVALLQAILDEVRAARQLLDCRRATARTGQAAVLRRLAAIVADRTFSAREVIEHAQLLDRELGAALAVAGLTNARKLGIWLRTIEGRSIAGVQIAAIGHDNQGLIWRVVRVFPTQTHRPRGPDDAAGA